MMLMPKITLDLTERKVEARRSAIAWARAALDWDSWLVLDSETTGLGPDAEVIEFAILHPDGKPWVTQRLRPCGPVPAEAFNVHGISDEVLFLCPTYREVHDYLKRILDGRIVMIYNEPYDTRLFEQTAALWNMTTPIQQSDDVMVQYAKFCGAWNLEKQDWKWQKLPALPGQRAHSALADCRSTLALIRQMAEAKDE